MKIILSRFSPRKETGFFSQADKKELPGLTVFTQSTEPHRAWIALSVRSGNAVTRNAIKREIRQYIYVQPEKFLGKKRFIIVRNWEKAKQSITQLV